jgi:DNA polymerase
MTSASPSLAREFDAALAWWQAAGVDCDFADDATVWLTDTPLEHASRGAQTPTETAPRQREGALPDEARSPRQSRPAALSPPVPANPRRDLLGDSPPRDLPAFRDWWLTTPTLDSAGLYPRIPPRGEAGAALMVLIAQPEEHDRERLLEGPQGRLLANILAAMGLDESAVYLASALPCHTPVADLGALAAGGMDSVLAHHIALARPQRVLALGNGLARMLGADCSGAGETTLPEINHNGAKVPVMVSEALDAMMDMPRLKARFWKRWIEWSAEQ